MTARLVTVFGGTGYLGTRIARALRDHGVRVRLAARHPPRRPPEGMEALAADVTAPHTVGPALDGAAAAVNAVSLYAERGAATFEAVHVDGARTLADEARRAGIGTLLHVSGIGADPRSRSPYVQARGCGEAAVREAFPAATIVRPSAMFGGDGDLVDTLTKLTRSPVVPLFGDGRTRLQPVAADDVAMACDRLLTDRKMPGKCCEFGGPDILTYRDLLGEAMGAARRRRPLLPVPLPFWHLLAALLRPLPSPPLTEGQVALMARDNVADPDCPGLAELGIEAMSIMRRFREVATEPRR